ncbi:hypothetical protein niasHS_008590 [Heterodera schachtii]|uniref:B30.2/SPRY domain-containing protein n=1 Tax=Heterodera schachtii TaxID=97005 RepID=A0ABD2J865_HETSC
MSISTNSINCGDDFKSAENGEVNVDAICLENGQEMELKMAKLELENKEQKLKLQEMMVEQKALKEKMAKIEQEKDKNANAYQFSTILEKISELEKQQKHQHENTTKANSDQFSKMQNDQKIILEKINELEKEQKQKKALLNFRQNYWDANVCHENLEIIGHKNLIVHYKGIELVWCSVFAVHPFLLNNNSSDIFYYEISIGNKGSRLIFGFALKQQNKLDGRMGNGAYSYESDGKIWINGERQEINDEYSYGVGDTVGIGVNSATQQIIFTKNGQRLDSVDFFVAPSFADVSFYPFVSLAYSDDQIEANFGPNFKFDLATL